MNRPPERVHRVLHVTRTLDRGGLEEMVATLALGMPAERWITAVAYVSGGRVAERLGASGHTTLFAIERRGHLARLRALLRVIRTFRPDVIQNHYCWYGLLAARIARVPAVETVHNTYTWLSWIERRLYAAQLFLARAIIAVSENVRAYTVGRFPRARRRPITVVPNAIETPEPDARAVEEFRGSLGAAPGEVTIGFSGRFEAPKGIPVLLAALKQLPAGVPPWRLHAFGEGSLGGLLHEASSRDSRIQVHPFLPGLGRLVAAFDVVVLPSLYEGLPLTLLEAMNGRCAIVASSVGGIPDAVRENTEALLVPPADPAALSGAIALLLNNPAERRRLGEAARQRVVEHFSVDGLIRATETVYRTLLHD